MKMNATMALVLAIATGCGEVDQTAAEQLLSATPTPNSTEPAKAMRTEAISSEVSGQAPGNLSMALKSKKELPLCSPEVEGQLIWLIEEKEFRTCDSAIPEWSVVSIVGGRGESGKDGLSGKDGVGCTTARVEGGLQVTCGAESSFVADGSLGEAGHDGADCRASQVPGGVQIQCGNGNSTVVQHGQNGSSCQAVEVDGGVEIHCEHSTPKFLPNGSIGAKGDRGDQGIQGIQGVAGQAGAAGRDGTNGQNARQVRVRMFPSFGTCPGGARTMWTSFYFDDNNNGYFDDADEEFMSESICEGVVGPKGDKGDRGDQGIQGIQGVAGQNGSDAAATKQLILYRDGVRIGPVIGENAGRSMNTNNALIVYVEAINRIMEFTDDGGSGGGGILFTSYYVNAAVGYIYNEYFDMRINAVAARIAGTCVVFENPSSTVMSVAGISYTSSGLAYSPTVTANQVRKVWRNYNFNNTIYCGNATPTFVYE
jgi:hypothetical protein